LAWHIKEESNVEYKKGTDAHVDIRLSLAFRTSETHYFCGNRLKVSIEKRTRERERERIGSNTVTTKENTTADSYSGTKRNDNS
jgi:hypothetical protein